MGEAAEVEAETLAQHALTCQPCRALVAGHIEEIAARVMREGPLKALVELTRTDSEKALDVLLARAEWSSCRRLTRRAQKDRVIQLRACHSWAFVEILLAELRSASSWEESGYPTILTDFLSSTQE
jgi:hypothetical protein